MDDLVTWLGAQLDGDQRVAIEAGHGARQWRYEDGDNGPRVFVGRENDQVWVRDGVSYPVWTCDDELDGCPEIAREWAAEGEHMARWDPVRVLAEVEAKRALIRRGDTLFCSCYHYDNPPTDPKTRQPIPHHYDCTAYYIAQELALPYRDRPGYRPEWAPEA